MKFHFIIIGIYIIIIINKSQVFAYDYNNKGVQYPHGVSSSGLNTKVNKDNWKKRNKWKNFRWGIFR